MLQLEDEISPIPKSYTKHSLVELACVLSLGLRYARWLSVRQDQLIGLIDSPTFTTSDITVKNMASHRPRISRYFILIRVCDLLYVYKRNNYRPYGDKHRTTD